MKDAFRLVAGVQRRMTDAAAGSVERSGVEQLELARSTELVVVDLETTGLDPRVDEIISFAAIPIREGRVRPAELVSTLLRPRQPPPAEGIRIHGLRESDLREQPRLEERIELIADALAGSVLVAHCAWIETRFLGEALAAARPHARRASHRHDGARAGGARAARDRLSRVAVAGVPRAERWGCRSTAPTTPTATR